MRITLLLLLTLPLPAQATKVKVDVPNQEHACTAMLDTKKIGKAEYERIAELQRAYFGPREALGFVDSAKTLAEAKKDTAKLLTEVEEAVREIGSFKKPRWKKLGAFLLAQAQAKHERESAMIAFMESWNPEPLLEAPLPPDEIKPFEKTLKKPISNPEDLPAGLGDDLAQVIALPLEDRDYGDLTCNQRLRLLADESKLEKFTARLAKRECQSNGAPAQCEQRYLIHPGMPREEREGKRMFAFQWAWGNNAACPYTRGKVKVPEETGPGLHELLVSALSQQTCEDNGCGD